MAVTGGAAAAAKAVVARLSASVIIAAPCSRVATFTNNSNFVAVGSSSSSSDNDKYANGGSTGNGGDFCVLLARRAKTMTAFGGVYAFPGGVTEEADFILSAQINSSSSSSSSSNSNSSNNNSSSTTATASGSIFSSARDGGGAHCGHKSSRSNQNQNELLAATLAITAARECFEETGIFPWSFFNGSRSGGGDSHRKREFNAVVTNPNPSCQTTLAIKKRGAHAKKEVNYADVPHNNNNNNNNATVAGFMSDLRAHVRDDPANFAAAAAAAAGAFTATVEHSAPLGSNMSKIKQPNLNNSSDLEWLGERLGSLLPIGRFVTPAAEKRRFDTVFYLATLDSSSDISSSSSSSSSISSGGGGSDLDNGFAYAQADGGETTELIWLRPQEALDSHARGELPLMPPQWYLLQRCAQARTLDELHQMAATASAKSVTSASSSSSSSSAAASTLPLLLPWQPEPRPVLPATAAAAAAAAAANGVDLELLLPGDGEHSQNPGPAASRHRVLVSGHQKGTPLSTPGVQFGIERVPWSGDWWEQVHLAAASHAGQ